MSVKTRILIPMIAAAVLAAALVLISNIVQYTLYVDRSIEAELDRALLKIRSEIDLLEDKASAASLYFSNDDIIINAIKNGNREFLADRAIAIFTETGIEIGAITDAEGTVLSRPYNLDIHGDNLASMHSIGSAIQGQARKATEGGPTINMMACAGAPIFDEQGILLGAVAVGFRMDTEDFVDRHKAIVGVEVTVFRGDTRVATTLFDETDMRAVGTRAPEDISALVLAGNAVTENVMVLGHELIARYMPIKDPDGNAIGMLMAGHFQTEKSTMVGSFIAVGTIVTVAFLAIIILILLFVSEHISSPIKKRLELIHYDELTGIYNRRYFDENIKRIIKSLSRSSGILSMMMLDIDCFKKYNDTYGHKSGDDCLQCIAGAIANSVMRADDFAARYGGEEFIIVLPNTDEDGARTIAERLLDNIRSCGIPHESSESGDTVTVSIGVVTGYPEFSQDVNDYIKHADEMLYQAKRSGKNQYQYSSMTDAHPTSLASARKALETMTQKKKATEIINEIAFLFLAQSERKLDSVLTTGINIIADSIDLDEISIWRNYQKPDGMHMSQVYRWRRDEGGSVPPIATFSDATYDKYAPDWEKVFAKGESVNSPVRLLSAYETYSTMKHYGLVSIFAAPIIYFNELWGFVLYADCRNERFFYDDSADVLRSAAFLFAHAVIRNELEQEVVRAEEMAHLMLDASPLCCQIWDRSLNTIDCNKAALKLYGFSNKHEYIDQFTARCSPEFQPDGQRSDKKAAMLVNKAFETGHCRFDWMHQQLDGTPMPAEITLVRVEHKDDYVVVGYTRDLREIKQIENQLEIAQTEAEEASRSASEFYTRMNHELLTPMNAIMGMTEILKRQLTHNHQKEYLNEIDTASHHLLQLIHDLLNTSRE